MFAINLCFLSFRFFVLFSLKIPDKPWLFPFKSYIFTSYLLFFFLIFIYVFILSLEISGKPYIYVLSFFISLFIYLFISSLKILDNHIFTFYPLFYLYLFFLYSIAYNLRQPTLFYLYLFFILSIKISGKPDTCYFSLFTLDRPGRCRDVGGSGICVIAAANCRGDYDCEYGYKCCPVGCGRECMPIAE